jgi:hypothetical protein
MLLVGLFLGLLEVFTKLMEMQIRVFWHPQYYLHPILVLIGHYLIMV